MRPGKWVFLGWWPGCLREGALATLIEPLSMVTVFNSFGTGRHRHTNHTFSQTGKAMRRNHADSSEPGPLKGPDLPVSRLRPTKSPISERAAPWRYLLATKPAVWGVYWWRTAGAEAMSPREVLGQAARLASSGFLLQVLCRAVPQPGLTGRWPWGPWEPIPGQTQPWRGPRYYWGLPRGAVAAAAERGHLGPELGACVQNPGWETANKPLSFWALFIPYGSRGRLDQVAGVPLVL